jgi:ABC-type polysaccharide/polyol phosphate transport system ATPase subunit
MKIKIEIEELSLTYPIISGQSFLARKSLIETIVDIFNKTKKKTESKSEKKYPKITALKNINFQLEEGDKLGLVGLNGSGKSTLLKCLSGILEPDFGSKIKINGSFLPIINPINFSEQEDTVLNNLILIAQILGFKLNHVKENADLILNFCELIEYRNYPFQTLSTGMRFKLIFSICFLLKRDNYFIDEFLTTGDEKFQNKGFKLINEKMSDSTIVLCSHSQEVIKKFCNKILVLNKGDQVFFGGLKEGLDIFNSIIDNNI